MFAEDLGRERLLYQYYDAEESILKGICQRHGGGTQCAASARLSRSVLLIASSSGNVKSAWGTRKPGSGIGLPSVRPVKSSGVGSAACVVFRGVLPRNFTVPADVRSANTRVAPGAVA